MTAKVSPEEAVEFIFHIAAQPCGVAIRQVMDYCECAEKAARQRIQDASAIHPLFEGTYWRGRSDPDKRWFTSADAADIFSLMGPPTQKGPCVAQPRTALNAVDMPTQRIAYSPREGAMDFAQWPSRRGNRLHYRDGTVAMLTPSA